MAALSLREYAEVIAKLAAAPIVEDDQAARFALPCPHPAGSADKVAWLKERAARGLDLHVPGDRKVGPK